MKKSNKITQLLVNVPLALSLTTFPLNSIESNNKDTISKKPTIESKVKDKNIEQSRLFDEEAYEKENILYNFSDLSEEGSSLGFFYKNFTFDKKIECKYILMPEMTYTVAVGFDNFRFNLVSRATTDSPLIIGRLDEITHNKIISSKKSNQEDDLKSKGIVAYNMESGRFNFQPYGIIEADFSEKHPYKEEYRQAPRISSFGYGTLAKVKITPGLSFSVGSSFLNKLEDKEENDQREKGFFSKIEYKIGNKKIKKYIKGWGFDFRKERTDYLSKERTKEKNSITPFIKLGSFFEKFKVKLKYERKRENGKLEEESLRLELKKTL